VPHCRVAGRVGHRAEPALPAGRAAANRLGEHVSDRRTASPTTSTLGTAPDSVGQTAANAVARLGLPHPSSVSLAAARLGSPLDDVDVVSLVGRPLAIAVEPRADRRDRIARNAAAFGVPGLTRIAVERAGDLGTFTAWRPALPVVQWSMCKAALQAL
jgi:hypothetical protein